MASRAPLRILLGISAVYTAANAYVHADQWLNGYRRIPTSIAGWWVVRAGFPVAAVTAAVLAVALLVAIRVTALTVPTLAATAALHVGSLIALIVTRTGSLFGWSEPVWTLGANQARATELGALLAIALTAAALRLHAGSARAVRAAAMA